MLKATEKREEDGGGWGEALIFVLDLYLSNSEKLNICSVSTEEQPKNHLTELPFVRPLL